MLRQIEWGLQNEPITKSGFLPETTLFFGKFIPVLESLKKSSFDVPTTPKCPYSYFS